MRVSMIVGIGVLAAGLWVGLATERTAAGATPPEAWNLDGQVAGIKGRWAAGELGRIGVVGDSIAYRPAWHQALRDVLAAEHGGGGYGWRGISTDFRYTNAAGVAELKIAIGGTATNIVKGKGTQARDQAWGVWTPDGAFTRVRSDGLVTITVPAGLRCTLHYLRFPGGGTLKVSRGNVLVLSLPTSAAAPEDAWVELPAGTQYKLASAGAEWVQVNALEMTAAVLPPGGGIVIDRFARGNDNPHWYGTGNTSSTGAVLGLLDDDLITIETDWVAANPQSESSFVADVKAYIGFVRSVNPDVGIILISHHQTMVDLSHVAEVLYQIAVDEGCGFIDHGQAASHQELVDEGLLMPDGTHLTAAGGVWFAQRDAGVMGE